MAGKYAVAIQDGEFLIGTVKTQEWWLLDLAYGIYTFLMLVPPLMFSFWVILLVICIYHDTPHLTRTLRRSHRRSLTR